MSQFKQYPINIHLYIKNIKFSCSFVNYFKYCFYWNSNISMIPHLRQSVGRSIYHNFKFHFPCSYWSTCSKYKSASLLHNIDNETFD